MERRSRKKMLGKVAALPKVKGLEDDEGKGVVKEERRERRGDENAVCGETTCFPNHLDEKTSPGGVGNRNEAADP